MSVDTAVARFRRRQADLFRDTGTVTRAAGEPIYNPDSGSYSQPTITVYVGPCLVRPPSGNEANEVQAGQQEVALVALIGKFPVDAAVRRDDVLTLSASTYDAALVGKALRIGAAPNDGWQICRRCALEEVVAW